MLESYPNGKKTLGKGEIARYEQFLLFPQCFHKACFPGASKGVIVWEWVKIPIHYLGNCLETILMNTHNIGFDVQCLKTASLSLNLDILLHHTGQFNPFPHMPVLGSSIQQQIKM